MRAAAVLLRQCLRVTMFTRPHCSLCDDAKGVLAKVWERRPFEYDEVDVMKVEHKKWKPLYEFDIPVVHVDATEENNQSFETTAEARKLKHRFTEAQLEKAMDDALASKESQG